jgi:hypothetical protein
MHRILIATLILSTTAPYSAGAAQTQFPQRRVLTLRPVPAEGPRIELDYGLSRTLPPFEKEPVLEGKEIARGLIPTVPPTPLVRNITDRELYVKADHGQDFTTGPLGTYHSRCNDGVHVYFASVRVFSQHGPLAVPYNVSLHVYQHGYSGWLSVQTGWSGHLELDGHSWKFTIVDNLDGQIDGQDLMILSGGSGSRDFAHSFQGCPVPEMLFLRGHTFQMAYAFKQSESGVVLETEMTEVQVPMGNVSIKAKGCQGVALRDDRRVVLLDGTEGTLSIPAGQYRVANCVLENEQNEQQTPQFAQCEQEVSIPPGQTAALRLGLPLSNAIAVTRDRNLLRLKYRLTGAGGEVYEYDTPAGLPSFNVYRGPIKVASAAFGVG